MKFCQTCGKEIMEQAVICPNCGCAVTQSSGKKTQAQNDKANIGLLALSIFLPIAGIILWPVMHRKSPIAARTYGLTGIIAWVVYTVLLTILGG